MRIDDLKVGDVIFALSRRSDLLKEVTITKIGRRYIHISGIASDTKIEKKSLRIYDSRYGIDFNYEFFLSMQDYNDEIEKRELLRNIRDFFDRRARSLSLDNLRAIVKILGGESKYIVPQNQRKVFPEAEEIVGDCECGYIVSDCEKFCGQCGSELKWGVVNV